MTPEPSHLKQICIISLFLGIRNLGVQTGWVFGLRLSWACGHLQAHLGIALLPDSLCDRWQGSGTTAPQGFTLQLLASPRMRHPDEREGERGGIWDGSHPVFVTNLPTDIHHFCCILFMSRESLGHPTLGKGTTQGLNHWGLPWRLPWFAHLYSGGSNSICQGCWEGH